MKNGRIDIGSIRREQIVDAAVAVIAEQGLQNLSLAEIEKKAGMSRGQLTYYFPAKEEILLAVFDRHLQTMCQRLHGGPSCATAPRWQATLQRLLETLLASPPIHPEFHCLQYTFLAQIGHRGDFRRRLATLYEEWRSHMAESLSDDLARRGGRKVSPRALASLIQAILHGLAIQNAADPHAFHPDEMVDLCLDMLGTYVRGPSERASKNRPVASAKGGNGD